MQYTFYFVLNFKVALMIQNSTGNTSTVSKCCKVKYCMVTSSKCLFYFALIDYADDVRRRQEKPKGASTVNYEICNLLF